MKKLGILLSGRGSNFEAIARNVAAGTIDAEIATVISNRPDARGLDIARLMGLNATCIPSKNIDRETFDARVAAELKRHSVDLVCLAGFMRLLTDEFVQKWHGRLINIHPSLLPAFKGVRVHERAIAAGVRISGCTVHFVTPEMDSGPPIAQAAVPVHSDDDPDTLAARVLAAEHKLYPLALRMVAEGRVRLEDGKAVFSDCASMDEMLVNPRISRRSPLC